MKFKDTNRIDQGIIRRACKEAKKSDVARGRIGAVVFTNSGNIVTSAHNAVCMGDKKKFTIHAERYLLAKVARMKIVERFGSAKLNILVVRYKPSIEYAANAKPCEECQFYLKEANIRTYYSDENANIVEWR